MLALHGIEKQGNSVNELAYRDSLCESNSVVKYVGMFNWAEYYKSIIILIGIR